MVLIWKRTKASVTANIQRKCKSNFKPSRGFLQSSLGKLPGLHTDANEFFFSSDFALTTVLFAGRTPPTALSVEVRYDNILNMFGYKGHFCKTIPEVRAAVKEALQVRIIHILFFFFFFFFVQANCLSFCFAYDSR